MLFVILKLKKNFENDITTITVIFHYILIKRRRKKKFNISVKSFTDFYLTKYGFIYLLYFLTTFVNIFSTHIL